MRLLKAGLPAALAVGVVGLLPAGAGAQPAPHRAQAAGSDAGPATLPTAVRARLKRGENALDRAADYVDRDMPDNATGSLKNARCNMYAAWRAAKWIMDTSPPTAPPGGDGKIVAHSSGAPAPTGTTYATPEDTTMAVLGYQHDVAGAPLAVVDGGTGTLENEVSKTLFAALDRRDSAVNYIHTLPPPPPVVGDGKAVAHAAQTDQSLFQTQMPGILPDLGDELQQGKELRAGGALTTAEKRLVLLASAQISDTQDTINTFWPPAPVGDG